MSTSPTMEAAGRPEGSPEPFRALPQYETTLEWLCAYRDASDPCERDEVAQGFALACSKTRYRVASTALVKARVDRNTWMPDAVSCVSFALVSILDDVSQGKLDPATIGSFNGLLLYRAQSGLRALLSSSAGMNAASGMVGLKRRLSELRKTQQLLAASGEESPSVQMVLDVTNERMEQTRAHARYQGMICTLDDFHALTARPPAPIESVEATLVDTNTVESDQPLHRVEMVELCREVIRLAGERNPKLGDVARVMFAPSLQRGEDMADAATVSRELGIPGSTSRIYHRSVRDLAQEVLAAKYAILSAQG